jgi:hypothetical protein
MVKLLGPRSTGSMLLRLLPLPVIILFLLSHCK